MPRLSFGAQSLRIASAGHSHDCAATFQMRGAADHLRPLRRVATRSQGLADNSRTMGLFSREQVSVAETRCFGTAWPTITKSGVVCYHCALEN
ncbi:hypothetical protein BJY04DRAFT_41159 [Aspergillus karnatakaensis]|uniref:uncharacterized protein n=1 Tax=Aspergillus karnatakaensis TaxID=1810916 RepID=UPI003CCC93F8